MIKIEGEKCSIVEYQIQLITIPIANYPVPQVYIRVPLIEIFDDDEDDDETIYPYKLRTFGQATSFPTRLFLLNEKAIKKRDEHTYWETLSSWNKFLRSKPFSKKPERLQMALSCYTRLSLIAWDLQKQQVFMNLTRQVFQLGADQQTQQIRKLESNIRQLIAFIMTQTTVFALNHTMNEKLLKMIQNLQSNTDWKYCKKLPVLNETCIEINFNKTSDTLDIKLTINGNTLIDEELQPEVCLDQFSLIKLIELIPALAAFKKVIDEIVKVLHFIPADIFKVCVLAQNITVTSTYAEGCVSMDINLMCLEKKCLWKGDENFGCFHIPI